MGVNSFTRIEGDWRCYYVNLASRSGAPNSQSLQQSANIEHGFVLAEIGESQDERAQYVEKVMSD